MCYMLSFNKYKSINVFVVGIHNAKKKLIFVTTDLRLNPDKICFSPNLIWDYISTIPIAYYCLSGIESRQIALY